MKITVTINPVTSVHMAANRAALATEAPDVTIEAASLMEAVTMRAPPRASSMMERVTKYVATVPRAVASRHAISARRISRFLSMGYPIAL
ncbi:Uncharacterised protein [Collinsella intestinalis]|nr:Uncharacterised protein [Collinsella intestinalis]